jgi:hypothetical protein
LLSAAQKPEQQSLSAEQGPLLSTMQLTAAESHTPPTHA